MSYLADSLLVAVDCTGISGGARENLFMNSRDRLRDNELRRAIEAELEDVIQHHTGLKDLANRRRAEDIADRLADAKPLEDILKSLIARSPALSSLFGSGASLPNPFKSVSVKDQERKYEGQRHPTVFKFRNHDYGKVLERDAHLGNRARILFETDAANDYFSRDIDKGEASVFLEEGDERVPVSDGSLNLQNGVATLNVSLPATATEGDVLSYVVEVTDRTRIDPFVNRFRLNVRKTALNTNGGNGKRSKPPSKKHGGKRQSAAMLAMPRVVPITEDQWANQDPPFDKTSAVRIKQAPAGEGEESSEAYDFFVNVDNHYLRSEQKGSKLPADLVRARFVWGLVLVGLAVIQEENKRPDKDGDKLGDDDDAVNVEALVERITRAVSPVIVPLIDSLGALDVEPVALS
jgi:hypothetical protein